MSKSKKQQKKVSKPVVHLFNKKWFIVVIAVTVFLCGSIIGWLYTYNLNQKQSTSLDTISALEAKKAATLTKAQNDAQRLLDNGSDIKVAAAIYDDAIKSAADSSSKSALLLNKATMYFNNNNLDEALKYALESESISKGDNIEQFIAQIYEAKGDKQNAIKYYQSAIQLVNKSLPMADEDIKYYQSKVDQLGGNN